MGTGNCCESGGTGRRTLFDRKPLCLHRQQHRGIPQPARVRATQSGPAFRLRLLKFGLRRQYENTLFGGRPGR